MKDALSIEEQGSAVAHRDDKSADLNGPCRRRYRGLYIQLAFAYVLLLCIERVLGQGLKFYRENMYQGSADYVDASVAGQPEI